MKHEPGSRRLYKTALHVVWLKSVNFQMGNYAGCHALETVGQSYLVDKDQKCEK